MAGENDRSRKIYYSMGEVAEMLDVSTSLVRFWEKQFDILTPHKNKKGNRMFSPEDVRNLKTIYHLVKERGMTLAGAAKYLKANKGAIERDMEIAERLASIRALLLEVRNELGGDGTVIDVMPAEEVSVEQLVEQAHQEEVVDAMMEEAIEELAGDRNYELRTDAKPSAIEFTRMAEARRRKTKSITNYESEEDNAFANDEPEEMLDFDPQPVFEPEAEEEPEPVAEVEPPKPLYIEQTLF